MCLCKQKFKNIENLYQNLSQLKPSKQLDNLTQSKEDVFISKKLAALCFDAPVNRDLECFKRRPLDIDKITLFLQENNFPSLIHNFISRYFLFFHGVVHCCIIIDELHQVFVRRNHLGGQPFFFGQFGICGN